MKTRKICEYSYYVIDIGDEHEEAYEAFIPKFPNLHVYGDPLEELHEGVMHAIEYEIEQRQKDGRPIPTPDRKPRTNFKGKLLLRIKPELHERLYYEAMAQGQSLNAYIEGKLSSCLSEKPPL